MSIHLTKEELQEIWGQNFSGQQDYDLMENPTDDGKIRLYISDTEWIAGEGVGEYKYDPVSGEFTFLSDITFEKVEQHGPFTLNVSELEELIYDRGEGRYEGWSIETHTDTGDFDAEKGAMTDFEVSLYDEDGNYMGSGTGRNYFTAVGGTNFYESITFEKPEPDEPPTAIEEFDESVINAVQSTSDMKTKIWKMKQLITEYESSL